MNGAASATPTGKNTKGAAASSSSKPAKDAKAAESSSHGVGNQDDLQKRFQALKDSMPRPANHAGTTAPPKQGEGYLSKLQQNQYERNKAKAQGGSNQPAPSSSMPYDGPELSHGTPTPPGKSGQWNFPFDGPASPTGAHTPPSGHTPPGKGAAPDKQEHSKAGETMGYPAKEAIGYPVTPALDDGAAQEKKKTMLKGALIGGGAVAVLAVAGKMLEGDSSTSTQGSQTPPAA
jgi:hypothetical protein